MASKEEKQFDDLGKKIVTTVEKNVRGLVLEIHANLVDPRTGTPRDTGWAANNWIVQLKTPYTGTVGSPEEVNAAFGETSLTKVLTWKSGDGAIYLSNNVPYITRLNQGSSQQAPAGFVEKAIQRAINTTNRRIAP